MKSRKICALLMSAVMLFAQTTIAGASVTEEDGRITEPDAVVAAAEDDAASGEKGDTVTILSTNDIHGYVEQDEKNKYIGIAQVSGMAAEEDAILLDAGDATQGASFATVNAGQSVIRVMKAACYDAMALGNHEFDYGPEALTANAQLAADPSGYGFPFLSANTTGLEGLTACHVILENKGRKIGVIGLTTADSKPGKFANTDVQIGDEIAAAKAEIADINEEMSQANEELDAIVLLSHMGNSETAVECTSRKLLAGLAPEERAEIAAVLDGHSHTVENDVYEGIPIVQGGMYLKNVSRITLDFSGEKVAAKGEVLDYDAAMSYPLGENGRVQKELVEKAIADEKAQQETILSEEICDNYEAPLWGGYVYYDYAEPRIVETSYGDFVSDAFRYAAEQWMGEQGINTMHLLALENGAGIGATLPYGPVTRGDILTAFSHGNTVEIVKATPAQLFAALEEGVAPIVGQDAETGVLIREDVSGSFMQCSGLTYTYDPAGAAGAKVTKVETGSYEFLDRADTTTELYVVTTDYVVGKFFKNNEVVHELGGEDMIIEDLLREMAEADDLYLYSQVYTPFRRILIENDKSPEYYSVDIDMRWADTDEPVPAGTTVRLKIDGREFEAVTLEEDGVLHLNSLEKGPHSINVMENVLESVDGKPNVVYVNNYSGSGTTTDKGGYYFKRFVIDYSAQTDAQQSKEELMGGFRLAWSGSKLKVSWGKTIFADGYDIFVEKCGNKMDASDLTKTVKNVSTTSVKLSKEGKKALSGSRNYKCQVKAYQLTNKGDKRYIASTFIGHIAARNSKTRTDAKSINIGNAQELTLAVADQDGNPVSQKLNAKITKKSAKKKLLDKSHGPQIRYWSSNDRIATVSASGVVTAKHAGKCTVYAFAANGARDKIQVEIIDNDQ